MLEFGTAGYLAALTALKASWLTGAGVGPLEIHLYQNDYTPGPGSVVGDFVPADFDGYAEKVVTLTVGPYINPAGQAEIQNASMNWTPTGSTTPNTIYGYFILDTSGDYVGGERFAAPRALNGPLTTLTILPTFVIPLNGIAGITQPLDS